MANEYLKRTPTSTGNRRVFTWSGWVKRNILGTDQNLLCSTEPGLISKLFFNTNDKLDYQNNSPSFELITSQTFRDTGNWAHVLFVAETTASISSERIRIYVNGVRITKFDTETYPAINSTLIFNYPIGHFISNESSNVNYFTGEIADVFFIDGQALTPDVFGFYKVGKGYVSAGSTQSTDFRPGQWVPKTPRVIKTAINNNGGFGVNGFYLPMNDSNNFGADFHCDPNSIIKLQENLPQPRCRIDGVGDYTGALRDDPFKQYLVLALPFVSGGLQSGFGDYSAAIKGSGTQKSFTANGNVAIANTAGYYGSSSYFDGNGDYLRTSTNISDFQFGTGDFTIETWLWKSANGVINYDGVVTLGTDGNATDGWFLEVSATRGYWWYVASSATYHIQYNVSPNTSQWNHLAVCRKANTTTMYLNGVAVGINTNTYTVPATATTLDVGVYAVGTGNYWFNGYLQDLRIYKGVAKYKGGFDVPRPYTPVGIATWRAVPDSPANNFATWNAVQNSMSLTDGNLTCTGTDGNQEVYSTIGITTGKWYVEARTNVGTYNHFGVRANSTATYAADYRLIARDDGNVYGDTSQGQVGTLSSGYASAGNIVAMAIDGNLGQITYYVNGANVGGPYSIYQYNSSSLPTPYKIYNLVNSGDSLTVNFGQNPSFSGNTTAGTYTDSNNKGLFKYQPPSGFLALCEDNLPTPAISDPGKYFKTVLWTGDGGSRNIVGVGFTPDLVWIKSRTNGGYYHNLVDSVRGPSRRLASNSTNAEDDASAGGATPILGSFDYDGFSLPNGNVNVNESGQNYVAWCWRAGAGTTSTNTNGSITSVVSVNQDAGFSIVSYTGTGANATVGHGLGKVPKMVIIKQRSLSGYSWVVYHSGLTNANYYVALESTIGQTSVPALFNSTAPTSSVFSIGTETAVSGNGNTFIAYCWAEIEGFSKFGSYVGNNSTDGPFCYCGFRPAWVMIKSSSASVGNWLIMDNARNSTNPVDLDLYANLTNIESQYARFDYISNGFKVRNTSSEMNGSGVTYIFVAFAESPFQTANAK